MRACITIEYNGADYLGWQKNGENKTLCFELEKAFSAVCESPIKIVASGRTDAGVHAIKQVAHFDLPQKTNISLKNLAFEINKILPRDIRVTSIKEVSDKFHARYNVKSKTYLYKCYVGIVSSPLREGYFYHFPSVLNLQKIKECANLFVGRHDFRAFCLSGGDNEDFERVIISLDVMKKGDELYFYVKGKGFLYSMVRLIVGTLLAVGQNRLSLDEVKNAIEKGDKKCVGEKAPAHGLYLFDVEY